MIGVTSSIGEDSNRNSMSTLSRLGKKEVCTKSLQDLECASLSSKDGLGRGQHVLKKRSVERSKEEGPIPSHPIDAFKDIKANRSTEFSSESMSR